MKKLKLPVIRGPLPEKKSLSMDNYLRFISFNLKEALSKPITKQTKKMSSVDVPFSLKKI
jgi:hypothetical protein